MVYFRAMKTDMRPMRSMTVDLRSSRSFLSPGMADLRTKEVDYRLEGSV